MRRALRLFISVFLVFVTQAAMSQEQQKQWKLVWSDEFDYEGLPDPEKWNYEEGFIRNREEQYYTRERLENIRAENGMLIIEARKEQYPNAKRQPGADGPAAHEFASHTSASINTRGKHSWLYGRIEMRAKLPQGKGVWPALWMLGDNISQVGWPRCGEIDVMEYVGHTPDSVHGTLHFGTGGGDKHKQIGKEHKTPRPFDDFHVYAVEWYPDRIDFYFDDTMYLTVTMEQVIEASGENPFNRPHYLLLNLALGGSWGREIDDSILPQKYIIDYVRVYQQE